MWIFWSSLVVLEGLAVAEAATNCSVLGTAARGCFFSFVHRARITAVITHMPDAFHHSS